MENQELTQDENNSSTAILDNPEIDIEISSIDNKLELSEEKKVFPTDQDEITSIIIYLLSDFSKNISGQSISVDGNTERMI